MRTTEQLSRFALHLRLEDLPPKVVDAARLGVLDTLGVALIGTKEKCTLIARDTIDEMGGRPTATLIGYGDRTSAPSAAFVNAIAAHALEYDDTSTSVFTHTSSSVVPAVLAVAESRGLSGKQFLEAYIAGFELSTRVGWVVGKNLLPRGWHPNGIISTFGSAAGCARLLGAKLDATRAALGIAASSSSGIRKNVGYMTKPFHTAHAARNGVLAAMLAVRGYTADLNVLEQVVETSKPNDKPSLPGHLFFSFPETFAGPGGYDLQAATIGLGEKWELGSDSMLLRFHPSGTFPQVASDEVLELVTQNGIDSEDIQRVEVGVTPMARSIASYGRPTSVSEARQSVPYAVAVAVLDRKAGISQYSNERVQQEDVQKYVERVHVYVPDDFNRQDLKWYGGRPTNVSTRVAIILKDGRELRGERHTTRGYPGWPATWADVVEKFEDCASSILGHDRISRTIEMVGELEKLTDIRSLVGELVTQR